MPTLTHPYRTVKRPSRSLRPILEGLEHREAAAMLMIPAPTLAIEDLGPFSPGLFPQQPIQPAIYPPITAPAPVGSTPSGSPIYPKPTSPPPAPAPAPTPSPSPTALGSGLLGGALTGYGAIPLLLR